VSSDQPRLGRPETFTWHASEGIVTVTLNRPERLNALARQMQLELAGFWAALKDEPGLRCVILTGAGRAFCVGADTSDMAAAVRPDSGRGLDALNFCPARSVDVPVILALNGMCLGGALNFLADADIAIASEQAWLSDYHVTMGQVSGPPTVQLASKVSFTAVAPLALCGSAYRMSAQHALAANLVSEVVAAAELMPRATAVARMIAAQSPTAVRETLRILRRRAREPIEAELRDAWAAVVRQWSNADALEGPRAFAEKRPARWQEPE
jgi:enoyl-CoA hydratase/carnithine racemase